MKDRLSECILNELNVNNEINYEYRRGEFNKLPLDNDGFPYKLKITSNNGETKWLDITKEELAEIEKILTLSK